MKNRTFILRYTIAIYLVLVCTLLPRASAIAPLVIKVSVSAIEECAEVAAQVSGRTLSATARKEVGAEIERAALRLGPEALDTARRGGLELVEAATKHGDDIWRLGASAPAGARALALHTEEILPLARRIGPEVLDLEAKAAGTAAGVAEQFGDKAVPYFAQKVPPSDIPVLIGYAQKADSAATRELLLREYQKQGRSLLERLDWKQIMAIGLSSGAIVGTYKTSDGVEEGLKRISKDSPEIFGDTVRFLMWPFVLPLSILGFGVAFMLLRRWGLFRTRCVSGGKTPGEPAKR
jgi:hypothetical protein